jgi:Uma2 family endonuclease
MRQPNKGATPAPSSNVLDRLFRLSIQQYQRMEEIGVFGSDRVELLEGILVEKEKLNPPRAVCISRVTHSLEAALPPGWCVRPQMDVPLTDSQPQPDVTIASGSHDAYVHHHPRPSEIALVVEVADSTLEDDRTTKLRIYARAGIPVYWIVNLPERQIEVHTDPLAGNVPTYRYRQVCTPPDSVSVTIGTRIIGPIPIALLLPPVPPA